MPIYRKINKDFFKKWSHSMAYVLGFFVADGYITINKRGGQFFCIQIIDEKLLINIKKVMQSEHKISIRIPKNNNDSILYRIQIGSIEMCNDLKKIGFSENKTKRLILPNIPKKYFFDFVRGYFDGDGNVWQGEIHKDRKTKLRVLKICFTSCSHNFLKELKNKLDAYGINGGSLFRSKNNQFSRLQYSTENALKLSKFMYNKDIEDSDLLLYRKKRIFDKFVNLRL